MKANREKEQVETTEGWEGIKDWKGAEEYYAKQQDVNILLSIER